MAFKVAEENLRIPQLLSSTDISYDEQSIMTYLSFFKAKV